MRLRGLLLGLCVVVCGCTAPLSKEQQHQSNELSKNFRSSHKVVVVVIDDCEYIVVDETHQGQMMSHKGNCKYCAKRVNPR